MEQVRIAQLGSFPAQINMALGWMSSLGWIASVTSSVFIVAVQVQAMINVTDPEYAFKNW